MSLLCLGLAVGLAFPGGRLVRSGHFPDARFTNWRSSVARRGGPRRGAGLMGSFRNCNRPGTPARWVRFVECGPAAQSDEPSDSRSFASFAFRRACKRSNSRIASNSWRFIAVW